MIKIKVFLVLTIVFLSISSVFSEEEPKAEKNKEILDFSSIKDIIKKDGLEGELKKKQDEKRKYLDTKKLQDMKKFNVPTDNAFWSFFRNYGLLKMQPY